MRRQILKYGEYGLQQPAAVVADVVTAEVQALVRDMIETMYSAPGIGLAAPQVGVPLRIFVLDLSVGRDASQLLTLINPELEERTGMQLEEEGCLSVPGFSATVARPARVRMRGVNQLGVTQVVEGEGLLARALQHEMDHLDGRLFTDRLRGIQREVIVRRIKKLTRSGQW